MIEKKVTTVHASIFIAGDYNQAKQICREYCDSGACVSLSKVDYIYKYGEESGLEVKIINYPRFPKSKSEIKAKAMTLGMNLLTGLSQGSFSIVFDDKTVFVSRREQDKKEILQK